MGGADVIKMQLSCMSSAKVIGARASIIAGADCRIGTINYWYYIHTLQLDMNYISIICFLFCGPLLIILINTTINIITEIFRLNFVHKN